MSQTDVSLVWLVANNAAGIGHTQRYLSVNTENWQLGKGFAKLLNLLKHIFLFNIYDIFWGNIKICGT